MCIRDRLKSKYTVIMVTHNMLQALRVSDKTAFFLLGEMVEAGSADDILSLIHIYGPRRFCARTIATVSRRRSAASKNGTTTW